MNNSRRAFFKKKQSVGPDPDAFIMTFALGASDSITLPLMAAGSYNFTVEWGDGTSDVITSGIQAERVHSYAGLPAGDYVVTITGTCTNWNFASITASRTKLKSVDQWGDIGLLSLTFNGCTGLTSVAGGLKFYGTNLSGLFQECINLPTVPANLFEFCSSVTLFAAVFYRTSTSDFTIPAGLFDNCTSATNFSSTFFRCRFTSIPANLFDNCPNVTTFAGCFAGNALLTTIPTDLFRYNTAVTTFGDGNTFFGLFSGCTSLTTLPTDLFRYNTAVTDFRAVFYNTRITSAPGWLFQYNTAVTAFDNAFALNPSLVTIDADLFRYNTSVTRFLGIFRSCSGLTSLPVDLFRYNTAVTTFQDAFQSCNGFGATSVPADLFRYNTAVTTFASAFYLISNNAFTIPAGLFQYNTAVTSFFATFYNARFTSIPANLFDNCPNVTTFAGCFGNCINLVTIPADLFRYNTAVTEFGNSNPLFGVFNRIAATSIPPDIFRYNVNVTNYQNAFNLAVNLATSVSDIVLNMDMTKVTTTNGMFSGCTSLTGNGQDLIDKPKAAGYTVGTASNTGSYRTFFNCTALTDFATIPAEYK